MASTEPSKQEPKALVALPLSRSISVTHSFFVHKPHPYPSITICLFLVYFVSLLSTAHASLPPELPLRNLTLRCCTLESVPFVIQNEGLPRGFEGIAIDYLYALEERTGFRCDSIKLYISNDNSTGWDNFAKVMANCTERGQIRESPACRCDIGIGAWYETQNRVDVDFVPPFSDDDTVVVTGMSNTSVSSHGAFFLAAYTPIVWLCIAALITLFIFLKLLDRRFAPPDDQYRPLPMNAGKYKRLKHVLIKSDSLYRVRRALQSTCSRMIGDSSMEISGDRASTRQWVLNFVISLCALFFVLTYEATMTASLVQQQITGEFRTINDLKSCIIEPTDVCFATGDFTSSFWHKVIATRPCHTENGRKGPAEYTTYAESLQKVASGECKYLLIDAGHALDATQNKYCGDLAVIGDPLISLGVQFLLPKGSPYMEAMRLATLQLREEGAKGTGPLQQHFDNQKQCELNVSLSLTLDKLKLFFILAFSACGLIFLEMVFDPQVPLSQRNEEPNASAEKKETSADKAPQDEDMGTSMSDISELGDSV